MHSNSDNKEEYRFYFTKPEVAQEKSTDDTYKLYIIEQNNVLHLENTKLREETAELKNTIDNLEDESDFNTKRSSNLKGMIKNFHEIDKYREEYLIISDRIIDKQNKFLNYSKKESEKLQIIYGIIIIIFILLNYMLIDLLSSINICIFGATNLYLYNLKLKDIKIVKFDSESVQKNILANKIKEIVKAQDYIHEFIDTQ
tara:strand:- start:58 stop:657 length:600 start_codon:yes stop_codon:yes gene_type:complete